MIWLLIPLLILTIIIFGLYCLLYVAETYDMYEDDFNIDKLSDMIKNKNKANKSKKEVKRKKRK